MTRFHYADTTDPNMLYLVGQRVADPFFWLEHEGAKRIFLPSTDLEAFRSESDGEVEAFDVAPFIAKARKRPGDAKVNLALEILNKYQVKSVSIPEIILVRLVYGLREAGIEVEIVEDFCPERVRKSPAEISAIKENFEHTKRAFELVEQILADSTIESGTVVYHDKVLTSEFLKREVKKLLLDYDLENPAGLIISSGSHAAMPHYEGVGLIKPHQTIIVDIFPQSSINHYFADMTRTYVKGEPTEEIKNMYAAVEEAQRASLAALKPGLSCKKAYEISAQIIRGHGFDVGDQGYTHSLGHGLGVAIHEKPNLGPRSEGTLKKGHVVTVEPGLYYPLWGGVRIEDTVVITEDGHENITNYPQNPYIS